MHKLYIIILLLVLINSTAQIKQYDPSILPYDSLQYKISKVSVSKSADNLLDSILKFNLLLAGEQHKWAENAAFYKSIFDANIKAYGDLKTTILFETCVTYQKPLNDYISTKDSIRFKAQMHYVNLKGGIDRTLFEHRLSFLIRELVNPKYRNYDFHCIDQFSATDGYLRGINTILFEYKKQFVISKRIKEQNLLLKKLAKKGCNQDSIRGITYRLISDTAGILKLLSKSDIECYKSIVYAFSKSALHNPSFFDLWKIREEFLIENVILKSDSLRHHTIFFGGANHVNYTRYVDGFFGKAPTMPSMAYYLKQKFSHSEIKSISFDVINKNETKFTRSVEAVMLSEAKAYTNRFWQKLTANDTLDEFNLYRFTSPTKPFDYIILKKTGTDLYDNDDYLKIKR